MRQGKVLCGGARGAIGGMRYTMLRRAISRLTRPGAVIGAVLFLAGASPLHGLDTSQAQPGYSHGFPTDPSFFMIGVWLQDTDSAATYKAMGINTYIGLWEGPTGVQLDQLAAHGLYAVADFSAGARKLRNIDVVRAWMQDDEPDNAQPNGRGGYGDCILPDQLARRYREIRSGDSSRPVLLNFGQGVANPRWFGRGELCTSLDRDTYYASASTAADILSFDIYPAAEERQGHVMGRLNLVGEGTTRLKGWAARGQPVWAAIETTHINNPTRRPTPDEIRSEVWMAIVHGATGIFYFVHEWQPTFRSDGIMRYPDAVAAVAQVNREVAKLAPVINSPTLSGVRAPAHITTLAKEYGDDFYVFSVNLEPKPVTATLSLDAQQSGTAIVIGEDRIVPIKDGKIEDRYPRYGVRLYKIPLKQ